MYVLYSIRFFLNERIELVTSAWNCLIPFEIDEIVRNGASDRYVTLYSTHNGLLRSSQYATAKAVPSRQCRARCAKPFEILCKCGTIKPVDLFSAHAQYQCVHRFWPDLPCIGHSLRQHKNVVEYLNSTTHAPLSTLTLVPLLLHSVFYPHDTLTLNWKGQSR